MPSDAVVRARIDATTKAEAAEALAEMGLSISDYIRMALVRVARDRAVPFPVKVPNALTVETMRKTERGEDMHRAKDADDLFRKVGI